DHPEHAYDGLYTVTLTVIDTANKTSSITKVVQIDTTAPTLVVSAPVNNENTSSQTYTLVGTSRDTGGTGFDGTADVEYRLGAGAWTSVALNGTNWTVSNL